VAAALEALLDSADVAGQQETARYWSERFAEDYALQALLDPRLQV
jgi:hypothetical protein